MKLEIRADGLHISGYVNVTEKMSRPVVTGKGQRVIEVIEPRAFAKALEKAGNIPLTKDHVPDYVLAETRAGTLKLREDAIGLHAEALVTDPQTIAEARAGAVKGWSFGMRDVEDVIEERADALPLRRVRGMTLDHITLVVHKVPCYAATSIEVRADTETQAMEYRAMDDELEVVDNSLPAYDNSEYKNRLEALKKKEETK